MDDVTQTVGERYQVWVVEKEGDPPKGSLPCQDAEDLVRWAKIHMKSGMYAAWVTRVSDGVRIYPGPSLRLPGCPLNLQHCPANQRRCGERAGAPRPPNRRRVGSRG